MSGPCTKDAASPFLGARVRILDAKDIVGRVVAVTSHLDGTTTFGVDYWSNGSRSSVGCRADEMDVIS